MKLWEKRSDRIFLKIGFKRWRRNNRILLRQTSAKTARPVNNHNVIKVVAPAFIDLYKARKQTDFLKFLQKLEQDSKRAANKGLVLSLCFRNTFFVSAAAALVLLAKVETIKNDCPRLKMICTYPPKFKPGTGRSRSPRRNHADSIFNRVGLYEALGLEKRNLIEDKTVKCWTVLRGESVSSIDAGKLFQRIESQLGIRLNNLFRPLIEAMANAVEHGYPNQKKKQWWMFAAIFPGTSSLVVLLFDAGVGIPATLEKTQPERVLATIKSLFSLQLDKDSAYIKAALEVKETRTKLKYRGKGGSDLKSIIKDTPKSSLFVLSNRGSYTYNNPKLKAGQAKVEYLTELPYSIKGTLVEWSVPIETK